jgi:hypothetical protein
MLSAVATPSVQVNVSAMITPNRISEMRSIGSRARITDPDLIEDCAIELMTGWFGLFSVVVMDAGSVGKAGPLPENGLICKLSF